MTQPEFDWFGPNGKLERAFWEFHTKNPHVLKLLVKYAREWRQYHGRCGIQLLWERVRWDVMLHTKTGDDFKLNNNHTAFYARLIEITEPDLAGFFNKRKQRVQSSFGPDNRNLPPGGHVS